MDCVPDCCAGYPRSEVLESDQHHIVDQVRSSLFGQARDKAEMFRHRYAVLHQRTSRHSLFTPSILGAASSNSGASGSQKYQLKPIEYLLGMSSKLTNVVVLGMLTHLTEGKLYLEDTTGSVPVSLKDTVRII